MKTTKQILLEAADLIEKRGWTRGWFYDPNGRLCILGACASAIADVPSICPSMFGYNTDKGLAYTAVNDVIAKLILGRYRSVPDWNDAPHRTKEEVIDVLRKAAELA